MPSQTDLDQGGTTRLWVRQYLGPSIGWVDAPARTNWGGGGANNSTIVAVGTYPLDLVTNFVQVSVNGAVTIILPSALLLSRGVTQPGGQLQGPITIVDTGGFAAANPITIKPISVSETIMGLTQIQITSNFGGFILEPSNRLAGWVNAQ